VAHLLGMSEPIGVGRTTSIARLAVPRGLTYRLRDDGWLDTVYSCFVAPPTLFGGAEAFGNSISAGPTPGRR